MLAQKDMQYYYQYTWWYKNSAASTHSRATESVHALLQADNATHKQYSIANIVYGGTKRHTVLLTLYMVVQKLSSINT